MRRPSITLLLALCLLSAQHGGAQIIRTGRYNLGEPQLWASASAALQQSFSVFDGTTASRWEFGDATQYGASLEKSLNSGITFALRGGTSRPSVNYVPQIGSPVQADATVSQAFAGVHVANGRGFHTVIELGLGATVFSNFTSRTTGTKLAPTKADADFTFVFGYGAGYTVNRNFTIDVVQDLATAMHQKEGIPAGDPSSTRISDTRLVARFGF